MAGPVAVQVARENVFETCIRGSDTPTEPTSCRQQQQLESKVDVRTPCVDEARVNESVATSGSDDRAVTVDAPTGDRSTVVEDGENPAITVVRHSRLAPYKPGKMTVVLDMDECLLHSKFHGPGAAAEAYRQVEERPDLVSEVNSFWVALEDGDTAQVNKRPGLDPFLEALARDYNTIVFTAAMPDYAGPVLDYIDPKGTFFHRRLYRSSCRQVKGAFLKDLSVLGVDSTDMTRTVLVDNNPLSFICQPMNGVLVSSFYDDPDDTALASVMQLIRHLDHAGDVRPILNDMFQLETLLTDYRKALFDTEEEAHTEADVSSVDDDEGGVQKTGQDDPFHKRTLLTNVVTTDPSINPVEEEGLPEDRAVDGMENARVSVDSIVDVECTSEALKDDDDESVETEPCSEESGESSLGDDSAASGEEMELDLEF